MSELTRASRQLLASATVPGPSAASRQRIKTAVLAAVVPAAGAGLGASAAGASKSAAGVFSGLFGKVLAGSLAVCVGAGGTYAVKKVVQASRASSASRPSSPAWAGAASAPLPAAAAGAPVAAAQAPAAAAPQVSGALPAGAGPGAGGLAHAREGGLGVAHPSPGAISIGAGAAAASVVPPSTVAVAVGVAPAGGRSTAAVAADSPPLPPPPLEEAASDPQLKEELRLLRAAMVQRDAHDWNALLGTIDAYDAAFPSGKLALEAMALRVLGLCGLSRPTEARAVAHRLTAIAPGSPTARSLSASCAAP